MPHQCWQGVDCVSKIKSLLFIKIGRYSKLVIAVPHGASEIKLPQGA